VSDGNLPLVKSLIITEDINAQTSYGNTPLLLAAGGYMDAKIDRNKNGMKVFENIIDYLLTNRARTDIINDAGSSFKDIVSA